MIVTCNVTEQNVTLGSVKKLKNYKIKSIKYIIY